jgi:hypothetical protein
MDIFDIQNPECDPEKLFKEFKEWSLKNNKHSFSVGNLRFGMCELYNYFISKEIISQLLIIWKEAGFIYEVTDDKSEELELFYFTKV